MYGAAILIQITIKIFLKNLDCQQNNQQEYLSGSSMLINKVASINMKHSVSLGSVMFFVLALSVGLAAGNATRSTRLFVFIPWHITAFSVIFPLLIIFGNPKIKKDFV